MADNKSATCIILGEGQLPLQCIEVLIDKGFKILAFISRDENITNQVIKFGFPVLNSPAQLDNGIQPDYIFSINNGIILKPDFISKARIFAANYHDSPLPKYAGMYAPNWALLNHEKKHAVTWHILEEGIDTGDILEQEFLDINDGEPVWSLNIRCFEAALNSFVSLIDKLAVNKFDRTPQDLSQRTYNSLMSRPYNLGLVSPSMTIEEISTLFRATNYGQNYDNEFLLPHIFIGSEYYTLVKCSIKSMPVSRPGSIVDNEGNKGLECLDGVIIPEKLFDKNNRLVEFSEVLELHSLVVGQRLQIPEEHGKIDEVFAKLCKNEMFWKNQISKAECIQWPYPGSLKLKSGRQNIVSNFNVKEKLTDLFPQENQTITFLALTAACLIRISDQDYGTFGFIPKGLNDSIRGFSSMFKYELPLNIDLKDIPESLGVAESIIKSINKIEKSGTYTVDLPIRYPSLNSKADEVFPVILCHEEIPESLMKDNSIYIYINDNGLNISVPGLEYKWGSERFFEVLQSFINEFILKPEAGINSLSLYTDKQFKELIGDINKPVGSIFPIVDVVSQFDLISGKFGEKPAIVDAGVVYSYSKFKSDITNFASYLSEKGVGKGDIVMICLPRGYNFLVTQWAALCCNAAFLPIDSTMPDDRKIFIFNDSNSTVVVSDDSFKSLFPESRTVLFHEITGTSEINSFRKPNLADMAYLIYTSGSTGVPKGVIISHKALKGFVSAAIGVYDFKDSDRVLQFSNLGFDASIEEIFSTLCVGGTLYLRNDEMLDPDVLLKFVSVNAITVLDFPTAFWRQVIMASSDDIFPESVRSVIIGGEAVSNSDFELWKNHPSCNARLFNTYGPTEATVVATVFEITSDFVMESSIPIGNPMPGYKVYITDRGHSVLPQGLQGELLISGASVADGYLNRDEVEKKAFVTLSVDNSEERCYCSGDLVYMGENGKIYYIGRSDGQLKIRGYRVEPGEIENQIMALGGVEQCMVIGKPNDKGDKSLIAFFVPGEGRKNSGEILKSESARILPGYMVPDNFIEISEIPITPNGKTDKKALLNYVIPIKKKSVSNIIGKATQIQETLLKYWCIVLEDESLSIDDDFFENGGHSLRAVRLMSLIKKELGIHLPLSSLISYPTPRSLGDLIESNKTDVLWKCLVPIRPKGNKMPLYLIHGAGLNVLLYQSLGNLLDPDRPIYAMQAKGLDGKNDISTSIEEMARDYIKEIKTNQPEGPYAILGFSLGGFIAYEMGQQFLKQGDEIAFLGVIDTITTFTNEDLPAFEMYVQKIKALFGKPLFFIYALIIEPWQGKIDFVKQKIKNIKNKFYFYSAKFGFNIHANGDKEKSSDEPVYLSSKVSVIIDTALDKYVIKPSDVTVDLFRAAKQTFYIAEKKSYGWSKYALKGVEVHNVPGEHSRMFAPPNNVFFAKILTDRLNDIEKESVKI